MARYVLRAARSVVLTVLPSARGIDRRRASLRYARSRAGAAWYLVRSRLIGVYARTPDRFVPLFGRVEQARG